MGRAAHAGHCSAEMRMQLIPLTARQTTMSGWWIASAGGFAGPKFAAGNEDHRWSGDVVFASESLIT